MGKRSKILLWTGIITLSLVACRHRSNRPSAYEIAQVEKHMVGVNKYLVGVDTDHIKAYLKRHRWEMKTTRTGLWYMIYKKGNGARVKAGDQVTMNYKVWLLDGTLCYSSDKTGPKTFIVGKSNIESGLDEGVRMLRVGDKARFILPPYLADGLLGDQDRIPPRSIILYDVELTHIKK